MKTILLMLVVMMVGCSSAKLKKCQAPSDPTLMVCKDHVQGEYHMCEKPVDLYSCQDPQ